MSEMRGEESGTEDSDSFTALKLNNEAVASKLSAGLEFCPLVRLHAHPSPSIQTQQGKNTPLLDVDSSLIFWMGEKH